VTNTRWNGITSLFNHAELTGLVGPGARHTLKGRMSDEKETLVAFSWISVNDSGGEYVIIERKLTSHKAIP
jgi:hypothetical protein